jgi:peptidoglycan/LPS O-acetylase OafA/YrhL
VPSPIQADHRYVAALDGIRAFAVVCVILFHVNFPSAAGGMLGVGVFFTLSGYLITDLLLDRWRPRGHMGLKNFWLGRARRLLPALFVVLAVVSVCVALFDASQLAGTRRQVIAAVFYFNNWSTIAQNGSYFARFAMPLPLDHLWSLAIEEQFYLVWPWLLLAGVKFVRSRSKLALLTLIAAAGSAIAMGVLYHPGYDPTRVYEGTDTRAFALLIGAALAMVLPLNGRSGDGAPRAVPADVRHILDGIGLAGLVCVLVLVFTTSAFSSFLYPYGFLLLSFATVAMIVAALEPTTKFATALSWEPVRWVGVRSYGIYLWQWPIIVLASPSATGFNFFRAALEVGATVLIASLSWKYVEDPIRHGALGRLWRRARAGASGFKARREVLGLSSTAAVCSLLAIIGLAGVLPTVSASIGSTTDQLLRRVPKTQVRADAARAEARRVASVLPALTTQNATRTSCRSVVYIGDSTSEGSVSSDYLPNPAERLGPQLADVGVTDTIPEISGARSIVETFEGQPNAQMVAQRHMAGGFSGCWIIAMGTNDVDNIKTGSNVGLSQRIDRMMSTVKGERVMWITAVTLLKSGPYAEDGMLRWNRALGAACQKYPNMRVFDWAARAKPSYFIPDGIHYYTPGYIARTHLIARGVAAAFPYAQSPSPSCAVH